MEVLYNNTLNSERTVEVEFIHEKLHEMSQLSYLDVGGIPTKTNINDKLSNFIKIQNINYEICDFRGGKYKGDFVSMDIEEKFDVIVFLSSLEHFPQCTEGDMIYRKDEDIRGFKKAVSLLNDEGYVLLTVPFGKPIWQDFHQNYDMKRIELLIKDTDMTLIEYYIYKLIDNNTWKLQHPDSMKDILYTDKCYGVGCFSFKKNTIKYSKEI